MSAPDPGRSAEPLPRAIRGGYINLGVTWLVQLALVPLLLNHLGRETYGLYATLTAVAGYFALLTFGSGFTVPRYVAEHAARADAEALSEFVSSYVAAYLAIGAVGLVAGLALTPFLASALSVPEPLRGEVAPAWRLVVAGWALGLSAGLFQSLLTGLGEVQLANLANSARAVLNLAVAAAVLWSGGRLEALLLGLLAAAALSGVALYSLVRRRYPEIRLSEGHARWATLRATARPATYYFLMQIAALVVMGTDNIVISVFLGVGAVAPYAVAFQLYALMLAVLWSGVDGLLPFFSRWGARGEQEALRRAFLRATKYAVAGTALCALVLVAFGGDLIGFWVGRAMVVDRAVLWVFAGMLLLATPIHTAALVLAGIGRHRAPALGGAVEAALNLGLSLLLVRQLGVLGVALGTLLAGACTNGWIAPRAACRELGISATDYAAKVLAPSLLPSVLAGGAAAFLGGPRVEEAAGGAALSVVGVTALFVAAFWLGSLDAAERREARALLAR